MNSSDIIAEVFQAIIENRNSDAIDVLDKEYKCENYDYNKRKMTEYEKLKVYINDGFIDRYSGKRLIFPNILRIISYEL
jgi:hypothetical protein